MTTVRLEPTAPRFRVKHSITELDVEGELRLVREPVIGLIKWLRPKGFKVCSYVEKCAEFKNQILKKKSAGTQKCYAQRNTSGGGGGGGGGG